MTNRPLAPWLWLSLAVVASPALAEAPAGAEQYQQAIAAAEQLTALVQTALTPNAEKLSPSEQAEKREQLTTTVQTFTTQLQAAADVGFAPAQLLLAQTLRTQAYTKGADRAASLAQSCEWLNKAAGNGLLIAVLGNSVSCSNPEDMRDINKLLSHQRERQQRLAAALNRPDPYADYYPLKAYQMAECFEMEANPLDETLSAFERLQASQPPELTLEETQAEAYFQLAKHEAKAQAAPLLAKAEALGCSSVAFTTEQKRVTVGRISP